MNDQHYLYCIQDDHKRFFKIGISMNPKIRSSEMVDTKVLFSIRITPKHKESAGFILNNGMLTDTNRTSYRSELFFSNAKKVALKWETFFKHKFKDCVYFGNEYYSYSADRVDYARRLFKKVAESETNALAKVEFIE